MHKPPPTEFDIALNIMGLSPGNVGYWRERLPLILDELANEHKIHAAGCVGAYIADKDSTFQRFYLFASELDLATEEGQAQFREAESIVDRTIQKHSRA
jgi:hypothetical protein